MAGRKVFQPATVLTAADVNNFLMDQSVMVFAGTAARSSAIGTATEGMVTYLEDSNSIEFWNGAQWQNVNDNTASVPLNTVTAAGDLIVADGNASVTRLGIGSNGQVLQSNGTTATWVSPASGGATLLSTTALSGATVNISSINQTYKDLILHLDRIKINASFSYKIFIEAYNASTRLTQNHVRTLYNGSAVVHGSGTSAAEVEFLDGSGTESGSITWIIRDYASSNFKGMTYFGSSRNTDNRAQMGAGAVVSTSAVDKISLIVSGGGTGFTSGNAYLYGVN